MEAYDEELRKHARRIVDLTPLDKEYLNTEKMATAVAALVAAEVDELIRECEEDPELLAWYRDTHTNSSGVVEHEGRHRIRNNTQDTTEVVVRILWCLGADGDVDGYDDEDDVGYGITDAVDALWRIRA